MKRFICEQNIAHFQKLLGETSETTLQGTLERLLATAKRELALIDADEEGAGPLPFTQHAVEALDAASIREQFLADFDGSPHPYMLLDPGPRLQIIDINAAYAAATFTSREVIVGRSLFEVFPDNPDDPLADGVSNLYASLKTVAQTGRPHAMAVQRYDVRDPSGTFVEKRWQPVNTPIHDDAGRLVFLLHHVEDVTDQVSH
ncbi:PAS domain-containing protein [Bradyrhizobium sp. HKCCYLS1011]|uniref:PAS domain-containing protein n=1 Tax=Bradyrhizobium sp. HKCCYLS1011 TaxID=3420733 RepID=UPI003EBA67EC